MKPVDVSFTIYIDSGVKNNEKDPKFKVGDHVRISSKYKNIFPRGYVPNCSELDFVIKKVKNTMPWTYVIDDPNGKEKRNCKRQIKQNL